MGRAVCEHDVLLSRVDRQDMEVCNQYTSILFYSAFFSLVNALLVITNGKRDVTKSSISVICVRVCH